tara:strand:+ start:2129 stop:2326 length:198 start_codon:yes stop_codon:yes gene_type:complete
MNIDKLKLFKSIEEIKEYARVNGYDIPEAESMVAQWEAMDKAAPAAKSKKVTMMSPDEDDTVEIK